MGAHALDMSIIRAVVLLLGCSVSLAAPVSSLSPTVCGNGEIVQTIAVHSHAINEAKLDWCFYKNGTDKQCTSCIDNLPAQPATTTIAVGASADFFVFGFKGSESGSEAELYPDSESGNWPENYDLQDPKPKLTAPVSNLSPTVCGNGDIVQTITVHSHAINEAKLDWCFYKNATDKQCTSCIDNLPAQPATTTIAVGASADFFVFGFKGSESGSEAELYPDSESGNWPEN